MPALQQALDRNRGGQGLVAAAPKKEGTQMGTLNSFYGSMQTRR